MNGGLAYWPPLQTTVYGDFINLQNWQPGQDAARLSRSAFDRKFRSKLVQPGVSIAIAPEKGPTLPRKTSTRLPPSGLRILTTARDRVPTLALLARPRLFRSNTVLFRSNSVVSAAMRTREVIETNRSPFRHNAERDIGGPAVPPRGFDARLGPAETAARRIAGASARPPDARP